MCVKAEMSVKAELEFSLDPKFECEAPTYVDFKELALKGNQYDDKADEWFGKTLCDTKNPALLFSSSVA